MSSSSPDALCYPGLVDIVHRERVGLLTNIFPIRSLSHTIFWHTIIICYDLFRWRTFVLTNFFPYDLYPIRYFGIRSLSGTIFFVYEHLPLRTLYRTNFIPYDLSAYELLLTNIWHTNISHTIFCPDTPPGTEELGHWGMGIRLG